VWLRVVQNLSSIREPEKFAGWLATVARNECAALIRRSIRTRTLIAKSQADPVDSPADAPEAKLLESERAKAVRQAVALLDTRCRELLSMLSASPPVSYADIGIALAIPPASIGPTRARCFDKLRRSPSIVSIMER
jgi:RNA polymerase sigma factor (sigma-70 family)